MMNTAEPHYNDRSRLEVRGLSKRFVSHQQQGKILPVFAGVSFTLAAGEAILVTGPSGCGKSSLLRCLYGNYLATTGEILIRGRHGRVNLPTANAREVLKLRRDTIGFVTQFLRVIPRITTLDLVMQPLLERGATTTTAQQQAQAMLRRLQLPENLWNLPPATFSGGERQRVNVARGMVASYPLLLLDEPTASLDETNREIVTELILEARRQGTAMVCVFHDTALQQRIGTRELSLKNYAKAAA